MDDVVKELLRGLLEKTGIGLKRIIGHLSTEQIKKRCCCVIEGWVHTYYLDGEIILKVDYEPKIAGFG